MTIIEQIKTEIERRIALYSLLSENTVNPNRIDEDRQLLSFISTLESEKPNEGLEEEIQKYMSEKWEFGCINPTIPVCLYDFTTDELKECARHFTQWQYQKDREKFAQIKAKTWSEGFDACKEQMMKDAVEAKFISMDEGIIKYSPLFTRKLKQIFRPSDKVKIIIVKEEKE